MGYFLALIAIFFWSWNIIVASSFAATLSPFELAFGRWVIAGTILIAITWKQLWAQRKILLAHWPLIVGLALSGIVIDNTLIYYAGRTASAVNIGLLDTTGPIFLVLLSRFFLKTPISKIQILGFLITILGVITIIIRGDFTQISQIKLVSGDFIMLINTFSFAIYSLLQIRRPAAVSQTTMLAATVIAGVPILGILLLGFVSPARLEQFGAEDLAVICYLGIFNSVLAYLSWNTALSKIGNVQTSIIYYLLPLFSGIEAYAVLKEQIYPSQIIGGLTVIAGIYLVSKQGPAPHRPLQTYNTKCHGKIIKQKLSP